MDRTVFSLPGGLHYRVKALAERRGVSMAALIRQTLEETLEKAPPLRVAEERAAYTAVLERPKEAGEMKRLVISLPDQLHERIQAHGRSTGRSMAAYIRDALEELTLRERPRPKFGAFASGFTDTGRMAGEVEYGPRSWR